MHGTLQQLQSRFSTEVQQFRKHVFNICHHYHVQHELRRRCQTESNECVLHIDFSENYSCGYSSEIQSVHFGALQWRAKGLQRPGADACIGAPPPPEFGAPPGKIIDKPKKSPPPRVEYAPGQHPLSIYIIFEFLIGPNRPIILFI